MRHWLLLGAACALLIAAFFAEFSGQTTPSAAPPAVDFTADVPADEDDRPRDDRPRVDAQSGDPLLDHARGW